MVVGHPGNCCIKIRFGSLLDCVGVSDIEFINPESEPASGRETKTLGKIAVFWAWSPKAWTLVTAFLVPHPCAVCCAKTKIHCKYQCFGHGRQGMDACDKVSCSTSFAQCVVQRGESSVNTIAYWPWTQYIYE